jgi:hypothetical protein
MRSRGRWFAILVCLLIVIASVWIAPPYARAVSLIVRAANLGGPVQAFAAQHTHPITVMPPHLVTARHGEVEAQFYTPDSFTRTIILIPGIHSMGIEEPRLVGLARELAGTGVNVMTMALPDLQQYRITPHATDTIEDAVVWAARQPGASAWSPSVLPAASRSRPRRAPRAATIWHSSSRSVATEICRA